MNDKRAATDKKFSYGVLNAGLMLDGKEVNPIEFLKKNVPAELSARGVPVSVIDISVDINKVTMKNHRTNAYTPFITFTMLSADVKMPEGNKKIAVYIKRGKVPVWSFDEIIEPTLPSQPKSVETSCGFKVSPVILNDAVELFT